MLTQLFAIAMLPTVLLSQVPYDYPDNRTLPPNSFIILPPFLDYRYLGVSRQLIPWSKYEGVKNNRKTIHPNRQVWQFLHVACRENKDHTRDYFYTAIDAETNQLLTRRVMRSSSKLSPPPCGSGGCRSQSSMTTPPFDQFNKRLFQELLSPFGQMTANGHISLL
jgi:hypothetical protein